MASTSERRTCVAFISSYDKNFPIITAQLYTKRLSSPTILLGRCEPCEFGELTLYSSSSVQYLSFTWNYYVQQNGMNRSHILAEDLQNHTTITFAEAFYQTGTANAGSKDSKIVPVLALANAKN